jgi:hypothetical protein
MSGMKIVSLLVAVAATASLVGCGADKDPASSDAPTREAANRKAALDYARCMRDNGVDMPDPQFSGGRVTQRMEKPSNPDQMRKAEAACAKYRESIKAPEISDSEKAEFKQAALANARCMREHGIDFPDPTFDANGGAQVRIKGKGLNPDSPKFQAAQKACQKTMPNGPSTQSAGEGSDR